MGYQWVVFGAPNYWLPQEGNNQSLVVGIRGGTDQQVIPLQVGKYVVGNKPEQGKQLTAKGTKQRKDFSRVANDK
jgi:hypothetical protein